jgi:hypothetical protein
VSKGLEKTAALWEPIEQGYAWVHRAARVLENKEGQDVLLVRRAYRALLAEMKSEQEQLGALAWVVPHFCKVTTSYWMGLFRCYETALLARTNNELEQCFGSVRYHERRASGRKGAAPGLVVRGQVRLLAAVATRTREVRAEDLRPVDVVAWRELREELDERREARRRQLRFRRDPQAYLRSLEERLLKPCLPT